LANETTDGDSAPGGPSPGGAGGRRPVTIDLAAAEVSRQPEASPQTEARVEPGEPVQPAESAAPAEEPIPSAFATGPTAPPSAEAPSAARQAARGASFAALLAAAVIGGVIAGAATLFAERSGAFDALLPRLVAEGPQSAENLAALRRDLTGDITALRRDLDAVRSAPAPAGEGASASLSPQLAALEQAVSELRKQPPGADPAQIEELAKRLAALEESARSAPVGTIGAAADPRLAALPQQVADLTSRLTALEAREAPDLAPLQASIAKLDQQLSELSSRSGSAQSATETRLAELQAGLDSAARQSSAVETLGPAVAADALAAALDAGAPYSAELQALQGLGVDAAKLAALEPHAAQGLPNRAALRANFEKAIDGADLRPPIPEQAGTFGRLLGSARGLVEVRPAQPAEGTSPGAVIARLRAALERGDLGTGLKEREALPPELQQRTAAWAEAATARLAADALVADLRRQALARIGTEG
jgi:hypothetical protein